MPYSLRKVIVNQDTVLKEMPITTTLASLVNYKEIFMTFRVNKKIVTVDLLKMLVYIPNIDMSQTCLQFASTFTDIMVQGYLTDKLPITIDKRFTKRLDVFDANAETGMTIAYTSMKMPDRRNIAYDREILNDLVVTSSNRDLQNTFWMINGVYHKSKYLKGEMFIDNGFCNIKNVKMTNIMACDTTSVGGHSTIPVTSMQIINGPDDDIRHGVYLKLPNGVSFKDKTPIVFLAGHPLMFDKGHYTIVSDTIIKININKIDVVDQFLNDPMTHYYHDEYRERDRFETPGVTADLIDYYFKYIYPETDYGNAALTTIMRAPWDQFDPCSTHFVLPSHMNYYDYMAPPMSSAINYFFNTVYKSLTKDLNTAIFANMSYSRWYYYTNGITHSIPYQDLKSKEFMFYRIFNKRSAIILINTPHLYTKEFKFIKAASVDQYVKYVDDMPRGFAVYNESIVLPYTQYSSPYYHQNNISLGYQKTTTGSYKTTFKPTFIAAPMYDIKDPDNDSTLRLLEFYK